jgi:hypothetical protein
MEPAAARISASNTGTTELVVSSMTEKKLIVRVILAAVVFAGLVFCGRTFANRVNANMQAPTAAPSTDGIWQDFSPSYLLIDSSKTWHCSNQGWIYLSSAANGSASSEAMPCTTPAGNDLSWAGGPISNLQRSGNQVSFDRANGIFGRSDTGCHIAATISADGLKGRQTCKLEYKSPFGGAAVRATVEGPWEAHRSKFTAENLQATGCTKEKTLRRPNVASAAMVLFENQSGEPMQIVAIGLNGQRVPPPDQLPAQSILPEGVPASTPLVLTDAKGVCKAIYIPSTDATKAAMP